MGAPKGNKNAEVYNEDEAIKLFNDSIEYANKFDEVDKFYEYDFIGEVARALGTYHHIYNHLVTRFPQLNQQLTELKDTLETNCYYNTKKGKIREATGIVNLKSNHKWTDRTQTEHSGEINSKLDITVKSDSARKAIENLK